MNSLPENRNEATVLRRLANLLLGRSGSRRPEGVLAPAQFNLAVLKEQSRCARQPREHEFSLVRIPAAGGNHRSRQRLAADARAVLRLVDEVALNDREVALLLPETSREGAYVVAGRIRPLADRAGFSGAFEIFSYPEDDPVSGNSADLQDKVPADGNLDGLGGHERLDPPHEFHGLDSINGGDFAGGNGQYPAGSRGGGTATLVSPALSPPDSVSQPAAQPAGPASSLSAAVVSGQAVPVSLPTPFWKSALDLLVATFALLLLAPVFAVVAIAIKLDSRGPVFFRQKREGKDGRVFDMLKFRTMKDGADALRDSLLHSNLQDGPAFKVKNDPRVTRFGRYLRKSCIDELPQLVNILWGDMSLVGPRPLPVFESRASRMWHRQRLAVLPGLTCLWQVSGSRDMKFDQWMRLDLEYIRRRSLPLDLRLIVKTVWLAVMHRGNV